MVLPLSLVFLFLFLFTLPVTAQAEGWVFIYPPLSAGQYDTNAPISQWKQMAVFDRAADCQASHRESLTAASDKVRKADSPSERIETKNMLSLMRASRCIPYDVWWKTKQSEQNCDVVAIQDKTAEEVADYLIEIRTYTDRSKLESLLIAADRKDASSIERISGVIAGARLRELEHPNTAPHPRVQQ
jgi:hypothetical protein